MRIIPAINCQDFNCVKDKLQKAGEFGAEWVQIDIADGKFTKHKTWNNPKNLSDVRGQLSDVNIEIHLMVENPFDVIDEWIEAGAKRIIIHCEAMEFPILIRQLANKFKKNIEIGLAINPNTPVESLMIYLPDESVKFIQLLAVEPGLSGQKFQPQVLDKIKFLKKNFPNVIIEIDGGINPETAKICKEAGADILAVGSYIFDDPNPLIIYNKLTAV